MGHPLADLAARIGVPEQLLAELQAQLPPSRTIDTEVWHAIARVFTALAMTVGPDIALRDASRVAGWVPPMGWDEDGAIDDPRERAHSPRAALGIDRAAVERRLGMDRAVSLAPDEVEHILGLADRQHWPIQRLADVLGSSIATAARRLERYIKRMRPFAPITQALGVDSAAPATGYCRDCHKAAYATRKLARQAANHTNQAAGTAHNHPYPCLAVEGQWHIGTEAVAARAWALATPPATQTATPDLVPATASTATTADIAPSTVEPVITGPSPSPIRMAPVLGFARGLRRFVCATLQMSTPRGRVAPDTAIARVFGVVRGTPADGYCRDCHKATYASHELARHAADHTNGPPGVEPSHAYPCLFATDRWHLGGAALAERAWALAYLERLPPGWSEFSDPTVAVAA